MADATRTIYAMLDLRDNQIRRFAVDNVDSLEDGSPRGRLVFFEEHLWLYDGSKWVQVADSVILEAYQRIDEKDQPGGYPGLDEDGKIDPGQIPTDPVVDEDGNVTYIPLIVGEVGDGQSIIYSDEAGGFIAFEVSTLYTFKGVCSSDDLDLIEDPKVGDVWNLTDERTWHGRSYTAGTSWAWEGTEWEPLAGAMDLSDYQTVANMVDDLEGATSSQYPSATAVRSYVTQYVTENVTQQIEQIVQQTVEQVVEQVVEQAVPDVITDWSQAAADNVPSSELVLSSLDGKTDVVMAVPAWDSTLEYGTGSTVVVGDTIYISLRDSNTGNDPTTTEGWWTAVQGGGGSGEGGGDSGTVVIPDEDGRGYAIVKCVTATVGNGTDTTFDVVHGMCTYRLFAVARDTSTDMLVGAEYTLVSDTRLRVRTTSPPAQDGLAVSIIGIVGVTAAEGDNVSFCTATIGDAEETEYVVAHGLGSRDVFVTARTNAEPVRLVEVSVEVTSDSAVTIRTTNPPGEDGLVVTVMSVGRSSPDQLDVRTFHQEEASDEWTVEHDLGTWCFVQVYGEDGDQMMANIMQDPVELDTVTVTFGTAMTGWVVVASAGSYDSATLSDSLSTRTVTLGAARMLRLDGASGEWTIVHGKGRLVLVQVYDEGGDEIKAEIIQDMSTLNSVRIRFTSSVSGTAVIM